MEIKSRREEKERIKEEQKKQRADTQAQVAMQKREEAYKTKSTLTDVGHDAMIDPETQLPYPVSGPLKIG